MDIDSDLIKWESKYNTGIQKIDEQHKKLAELINNLFKSIVDPDKNKDEIFNRYMQETVKYIKEHFSFEEGLLLLAQYPDYENHKLLHEQFILKIIELATGISTSKQIRNYELIKFLRNWLITHIGVQDKKYSIFVKNTLKI